jgi:hypothetical protein
MLRQESFHILSDDLQYFVCCFPLCVAEPTLIEFSSTTGATVPHTGCSIGQPSGHLRFFPDLAHFPHTNQPQRTRVRIAERQNEFAFIVSATVFPVVDNL